LRVQLGGSGSRARRGHEQGETMQLFRFDRARARESIEDPDGAIWPVNVHSDADELNGLVNAALDAGAVARDVSGARIYVYPMSLSELVELVSALLLCTGRRVEDEPDDEGIWS
jgi:hypothetical protein